MGLLTKILDFFYSFSSINYSDKELNVDVEQVNSSKSNFFVTTKIVLWRCFLSSFCRNYFQIFTYWRWGGNENLQIEKNSPAGETRESTSCPVSPYWPHVCQPLDIYKSTLSMKMNEKLESQIQSLGWCINMEIIRIIGKSGGWFVSSRSSTKTFDLDRFIEIYWHKWRVFWEANGVSVDIR